MWSRPVILFHQPRKELTLWLLVILSVTCYENSRLDDTPTTRHHYVTWFIPDIVLLNYLHPQLDVDTRFQSLLSAPSILVQKLTIITLAYHLSLIWGRLILHTLSGHPIERTPVSPLRRPWSVFHVLFPYLDHLFSVTPILNQRLRSLILSFFKKTQENWIRQI